MGGRGGRIAFGTEVEDAGREKKKNPWFSRPATAAKHRCNVRRVPVRADSSQDQRRKRPGGCRLPTKLLRLPQGPTTTNATLGLRGVDGRPHPPFRAASAATAASFVDESRIQARQRHIKVTHMERRQYHACAEPALKKNSSGRSCRLVVNSSSTHYSINVRSGGMAPLAGWKDGDLRVAV